MFYKLLEFFVADQDLEITETIIEIIKIENAIYIRVTKIKSHPFWSNNLMHKTIITNHEFNEKINANNYIISLLYDIYDDMRDINNLLKNYCSKNWKNSNLLYIGKKIYQKVLPKSHSFSNIDINKFNIKKINYQNIMEESKKQLYHYMNNYTLYNI